MNLSKHFLLLFAMAMLGGSLHGQAYHPFPDTHTHHFTMADSNNSGIGIWSLKVVGTTIQGSDTVHNFNPILRLPPPNVPLVNCNGEDMSYDPGWAVLMANQDNILGSGFRNLVNGDVEFFTSGSAIFLLKPNARTGDSWTFNAALGITAQVISEGVETILGQSDSVKVISLSSGRELALSKSLGMVRGFSLLPVRSLQSGIAYGTDITLWGIEELNLGGKLPGFDAIFGQLEVGDRYQENSFAYSSYGTTSRWINHEVQSKTAISGEYSYVTSGSKLDYQENYIFSGGSTIDTFYTASETRTVTHLDSEHPYLYLLPASSHASTNTTDHYAHTESILLSDGRVRRYFARFQEYDPCLGALINYFPQGETSITYEEGVGRTSRSNSYSGSYNSQNIGCWDISAAGQYGNCKDLAAGAGLPPTNLGGSLPNDPSGLPVGVWGNRNGDGQLLLVPGDAAVHLTVWEVSGRKVMDMSLLSRSATYEIATDGWSPGMYVFRVQRKNGQVESFRTAIFK